MPLRSNKTARLFKNTTLLFIFSMQLFLLGCSTTTSSVSVQDFDTIQEFTLSNKNGLKVKLSNYGATITSILVPDRQGQLADVVLGYENVEGYINALKRPYFGATLGRCANRIANGTFTLDGNVITLAVNRAPHHLHGGNFGFDKVVWTAKVLDNQSVRMSRMSKSGEEGYPGNLWVMVDFSLTEANELKLEWRNKTRPIGSWL
jgi:aldose 1-epimerase